MNYRYDNTFFGFLSVVFDAYHDGIGQTGAISGDDGQDLFSDSVFVEMDPTKAQRVLDGLQRQCGSKICHYLYYAFLAEQPQREYYLLRFLRQAFKQKESFCRHLSEPDIWKVRRWAARTGNERHRLLGLLRFRELQGGLLYGPVAPDCCVVPVMAPHFVKRLPAEAWVLHDVKRNMGVYYDRHSVTIVDIPRPSHSIILSEAEPMFEELWSRYYGTISIAERANPSLRQQFMPKKYWPWLIELE